MPNPRSKRKALRESRKRKQEDEAEQSTKRQRVGQDEAGEEEQGGEGGYNYDGNAQQQNEGAGETQFFGLLSDEEQEYFRGAAEVLELNTFPTPEERDVFVENVFKEAEGKELKLACSQGCSRLMEKLILLSNKAQKKHLFEAFAGNFLSLVQHRFASHCCEMLFLQSAPVVGEEFKGFVIDVQGKRSAEGEEQQKAESSMEHLFLLTLDELEGDLTFLLTQTYASHTLRALLLILSGRPLEDASTTALLKSKKKERISVPGAAPSTADDAGQQLRAVPESFAMATQKIISDTIMSMDSSSLRVLVTHPTGNPLLQLLLELDISFNVKSKSKDEKAASGGTLLDRLLPGAPDSLKDESSKASEFITSLIYDQIGSRLLETLIVHAPSKIFKAIYQNFFAQRIQSYVRNEIASYPAIKVLNRLGRDELIACVGEIIPVIPTLIEKGRFNVIKTLFERCSVREAPEEITKVTNALVEACDADAKSLVPRLCQLRGNGGDAEDKKNMPQYLVRSQQAVVNHGAQLISTMLTTGGSAAAAAQTSLLGLTSEELLKLATGSMATMSILTTALSQPAAPTIFNFHKSLVASLLPHAADLATSQSGHNVINEIISLPSRGKERSAPFHLKEAIMVKLAENEQTLRDSWMGRSVWRTWKGDVWKRGRGDWAKWAKEIGDGAEQAFAVAPVKRDRRFRSQNGGPRGKNGAPVGSRPAAVPANPYIARRMARRAEREKMQGKEEFTRNKREQKRARKSGDGNDVKEATREVVEEKPANGTDGVEQEKKKERREDKYTKAKKERQEKRARKEKEEAVVEA